MRFSDTFIEKSKEIRTRKLEAPERVWPSGTKTVAESLAVMDENRDMLEQLRPLFEEFNCTEAKFPHPFMGELSAAEWLSLIGGHEARHLSQIERILAD